MLSSFRQHRHLPGARVRSGALMAVALAIVALGATAGAASAQQPVNIVRQGEPPSGKIPRNTHYFTTIQAAVNASGKGAWVLIEPGVYDEEVLVTSEHAGIHIRGMDRNTVIVDGQNKAGPEGANGNEVWWNGRDESGESGAHGWYWTYLTAYDDGLLGGYGLFASNSIKGSL